MQLYIHVVIHGGQLSYSNSKQFTHKLYRDQKGIYTTQQYVNSLLLKCFLHLCFVVCYVVMYLPIGKLYNTHGKYVYDFIEFFCIV